MDAESGTLLTPQGVAEALSVSTRYVRHLAASGRLPRIVLGHRTVRYRDVDVLALTAPRNAESSAVNPSSPAPNAEAPAHDPD